jgi:hypothetical protein
VTGDLAREGQLDLLDLRAFQDLPAHPELPGPRARLASQESVVCRALQAKRATVDLWENQGRMASRAGRDQEEIRAPPGTWVCVVPRDSLDHQGLLGSPAHRDPPDLQARTASREHVESWASLDGRETLATTAYPASQGRREARARTDHQAPSDPWDQPASKERRASPDCLATRVREVPSAHPDRPVSLDQQARMEREASEEGKDRPAYPDDQACRERGAPTEQLARMDCPAWWDAKETRALQAPQASLDPLVYPACRDWLDHMDPQDPLAREERGASLVSRVCRAL